MSRANGKGKVASIAKYEIHEPGPDDTLDFLGILAAGGLAGQAQRVLEQVNDKGMGAAFGAFSSLIFGALANHAVRDDLRGFLFMMWKAPEDKKADEADLDLAGRLRPRFDSVGEPEPGTLYHAKRKRWVKLPMRAPVEIALALYRSEGFADFLALLRETPTESIEQLTGSSETTDSRARR